MFCNWFFNDSLRVSHLVFLVMALYSLKACYVHILLNNNECTSIDRWSTSCCIFNFLVVVIDYVRLFLFTHYRNMCSFRWLLLCISLTKLAISKELLLQWWKDLEPESKWKKNCGMIGLLKSVNVNLFYSLYNPSKWKLFALWHTCHSFLLTCPKKGKIK